MTLGLSAGAKPIKEAIYFPEPLGSFWEVAVLPPIENILPYHEISSDKE
jgi:hypothetical protein